MTRALAILIAALAADPAAALSCLRADAAATFRTADADPAPYMAFLGTVARTSADVPTFDGDGYAYDAALTGHVATTTGFDRRLTRTARVVVDCIDPWCPTLADSQQVLAMIRIDGPVPVVPVGMCAGAMTFADPSPDLIEAMADCAAGRACVPTD